MKGIDANLKKRIQRAVSMLTLEVKKSDELINQIQTIRKQFRGFRKLETLVMKTIDHENTLNDKQASVRVAIEKFRNCKTRDEALHEILTQENQRAYEDLQN